MNTRRWARISELLERAVDLQPAARRALYAAECADDPAIGDEVERLVLADTGARGFLEVEPPRAAPAAPRAPGEGSRVGGYTLVRRVASGGMGVVYEARQERPNRRVALKLVQSLLVDEGTLRRFRYEAEALGRLRHPGIAQVYEAGVDHDADGHERPFLAMEFVDGARPVTVHAREKALAHRDVARLFVDVCAAVQHGHERGVLHRDLKASNVLVDAAGAVKVIDFGIARVLGEQQTRATMAGELVGTLASMSPEQLDGDLDAIDVRSDVYALGALLYEMLCGIPPVDLAGLSLSEALARARDAAPAAPRSVRADVPQELEWIVLRALEPDRERRYASAAELAHDLERFLADEPVVAGPPSTVYRVRKFVRRNRIVVAAAASVAVALVAGAVVALVQRADAVDAKDRAQTAERLAVERLERLEIEARTNRELAEFQGDMLESVDPDVDGRDVRVVDVLARAATKLDLRAGLEPELELALRRSIADAYDALGRPREAADQIARMVPLWEAAYSPTDPRRMELEVVRLSNDAFVAPARERESRARDGLGRAVTVFGADSRQAGIWSLGIAVALADLGAPEEAEPYARTALEVLTAKEGPTSEHALDASLVLGRILNDSRRYAEALEFKRGVYETCLAALGEDRAETLRAKKQLAFAHGQLGRTDEAVAMLREVVDSHAHRTGPRASAALMARVDLAEFLRQSRRAAEALVELDSALTDARATLGHRDPLVLRALLRRSAALVSLGRRDEALADVEAAFADASADLGPDEPITLEAQNARMRMLFDFGRYADALPLAADLWARSRRVLGETSATTLARGNSYAVLLSEVDRESESLAVLEELLAAQDASLGPLNRNSLSALGNLATVQLNAGDVDGAACRADEYFARVLSKTDSTAGEVASAWWSVGRIRRARGDDAGAAECYAIASACWERSREAATRPAISALVDEGRTLEALGRHAEASAVLESAARRALESRVPPDVVAHALVALASALERNGDSGRAVDLARIVLAESRPIPPAARERAQEIVDAL